MRILFVISYVLMILLSSHAQTQQGYVKTKGRLGNNGSVIAGTRLSGATVTVKGGNAVLSGNNGTFSLSLPNNNSFFLQNVQKQGYVLTDPDVLSKQYALSKNPLVLVLEDKNQQAAERRAIERKISSSLYAQLQKRNDELEALKEQHKITEEKYRELLQKLNSDQDDNEKLISEMADRYSKMDFDEVDEFNRRISSLILEGKLTEADSLLNTKGDINSRAEAFRQHREANAQAEQELKKKQKKLEKSKLLAQKELEDLAQDCYSKFEIFKMQHQNDSAASYIKIRSELDTTNVEWLDDLGKFSETYLADYSGAFSCYENMLSTSIETYGEFHENTAKAYLRLAEVMLLQSNLQASLEYCLHSKELYHAILGDSSREIAVIYDDMGLVYKFMGKYTEAIECYKKALDIKINFYDETSADIARSYHHIGSVLASIKDYSTAIEYYTKALTIVEQVLPNDDPDKITFYNDFGVVYGYLHDFEKARYYYERALEVGERTLTPLHPYLSTLLNNIGTICDNQGDYLKALEYYNRSLNIDTQVLGSKHIYIAYSYNNIGFVKAKMGKYTESLEFFNKALIMFVSNYGGEHPYIATCLKNIGYVYKEMADFDKALEYYKKALMIRIKILGHDHESTKEIENTIESIKKEIRRK